MLSLNCPQCKALLENTTSAAVQNCQYCHTLVLLANNSFETLKCKGCFAPLKLEGELQKSKVLICSYCSTAMDSESEFKALYTFSNIQKPMTSLEVGMSIKIKNREFTVVSLIVYRSRGIEWLDFTLYSKVEGYHKLLRKDEQYLFLEKYTENLTENIWLLKQGAKFQIKNKNFKIDSFYFTEIYYAVGNIDAKINKNQRNKQCFAQNAEQWFYSTYSMNAIEYYLGEEITLTSS